MRESVFPAGCFRVYRVANLAVLRASQMRPPLMLHSAGGDEGETALVPPAVGRCTIKPDRLLLHADKLS